MLDIEMFNMLNCCACCVVTYCFFWATPVAFSAASDLICIIRLPQLWSSVDLPSSLMTRRGKVPLTFLPPFFPPLCSSHSPLSRSPCLSILLWCPTLSPYLLIVNQLRSSILIHSLSISSNLLAPHCALIIFAEAFRGFSCLNARFSLCLLNNPENWINFFFSHSKGI